MTHTEYALIVKNEILEYAGYSTPAVHYHVGDTITVDESTFNNLKSGAIVERFTLEGVVKFSKHDFKNEVEYTEVTIERGTRKLGQRNRL
jgi:hypothetical protein